MAAKIRKGDKVVVLAGRDKGRTGEVIAVHPSEGRALVRGVNVVKRHQKQSAQQEGGIADPKDGKPTRIGFKVQPDGKKIRVAKRSGAEIDG